MSSPVQRAAATRLVSVLMPVYNAAAHLRAAVASVLAQDFEHFELVCYDDGSSDSSAAVLAELAETDPRIRVLPSDGVNRGVVYARNALLMAARGEYIAWLDSDDLMAPDRLSRQVAFLEEHPEVGAVGTGVVFTDENLAPQDEVIFDPNPARQATDPSICCASIMARESIVRAAGPFRELFRIGGEDGDWVLRLADHAQVTNIPEKLYVYRKHAASTSAYFAPIRRLGVLARYAARIRRASGEDPLDSFDPQAVAEVLNDDFFLSHPGLTVDEKVLALSFPLRGAEPLISVLTPFYQSHAYVAEMLRGLQSQTFQNFELVIYDDGSDPPLPTEQLLGQSYGFPIRVIRSETNDGAAFARNRLLETARGRYIAWQDADDTCRVDRLWFQLKYLLTHPECPAIGSAVNYMDVSGRVFRSEFYPERAYRGGSFHGCCSAFMLTRSAIDQAGPFKEDLRHASEDLDLFDRLPDSEHIRNLPDILYFYRQHGAQTTKQADYPYHQLYFLIRRRLKLDGIEVPTDVAQSDVVGAQREIARLWRLIAPSADRTEIGPIAVRIAYLEWRSGVRSARDYWQTVRELPRASLAFYKQMFKDRARLAYEALRQRLEPVLPRGAIVGPLRRAKAVLSGRARRAPEARINVQVFDNWGDAADALNHLLPRGGMTWQGVRFHPADKPAPKYDYALFLNAPGANAVEVEVEPERLWIAIGEPPTNVHRPFHQGFGERSTIYTSDKHVVENPPAPNRNYVWSLAMTRTWSVRKTLDELERHGPPEKTKGLSWVTSNLALLPGHRYRLRFLERARPELPLDVYGRGFEPLEDKWEGLAPYMFSVAFENTVAEHYMTEKLFDCFVAGCVPFYYGAPDAEAFFPPESFIRIDPEDPDVFDKMRQLMTREEFERRRGAVREAKALVLGRYNMFKRLAEDIASDFDSEKPLGQRRQQWILPTEIHF